MKISPFQVGILVFSVAIVLVAVLVFSGFLPGRSSKEQATQLSGTFTVWGTFRSDGLRKFFDDFSLGNPDLRINYIVKDSKTFSLELAEAISAGRGPDLILFSQEEILQNQSKLTLIPYTSYPERTFRDTYIEEANLFLLPDGIIGFPVVVDPLVMYYNKGLLENAGYSTPPKTWDVLLSITPSLTKKKSDLTILQSAVSFGVYNNLSHAKDILSMLFLQAGDPIVTKQNNGYGATFGFDAGKEVSPAQSALEFFTQFSNPLSSAYTWNRAQVPSNDAFIRDSVAFYFGFASELPVIYARNPNLNFDIAKVPQISSASTNVTFGRVYAFGVVRANSNPQATTALVALLSNKDSTAKLVDVLSENTPLAPARRDLISTFPETSYGPIIYGSGLISRGWYDPGDYFTDPIMSELIDDVIRGAVNVPEAISKARSQLELAL